MGEQIVIPFDDEKLQADNDISWTHNQTRLYSKRRSHVKNNKLSVDQHGSLILENLQKDNSGEYTGKAFNKDGTLIQSIAQWLCVHGTYSLVFCYSNLNSGQISFISSLFARICKTNVTQHYNFLLFCAFQSQCLNLQSWLSV